MTSQAALAHLTACTIAATVAILAALLLPKRMAGLRYALLLLATVRFAIPTPILAAAGSHLATQLPKVSRVPNPARLLDNPFVTGAIALSVLPSARPLQTDGTAIAELLWAASASILLFVRLRKTSYRAPVARMPAEAELRAFNAASARIAPETDASLRIVAASEVPGVRGIWHGTVLLPDGLSAALSPAELEAVLAHELAHVRRRDNLTAAVVRVVTSVFWFHPLLWWMERKMLTEREAACDHLAIASGSGPREYAAGVLAVCRMALAGHFSPRQPAGAYASGPVLKQRMEQIMSIKAVSPSPLVVRLIPAVLAVLLITIPVTSGLLRAQSSSASAIPAGWHLAGSHPSDYTAGTDSSAVYAGLPSAFLKAKTDAQDFGTLMQTFASDQYKGRRIRLSANVKSDSVARSSGLWLRIDGRAENGGIPKMLGFDNMQNRPIKGTTAFARYEIVLDVPNEAVDIAMGIILAGPGEVWLNNVAIDIVPESVPVTGSTPTMPAGPQNLSFTK